MLSMLSNTSDHNGVGRPHKRMSTETEIARMRVWLAGRIAAAMDEPTTEIVTLPPVLAQLLLDINLENRKKSEVVERSYATDIADNRWEFNGESIIVSRDGFLNGGQHRCGAVILSGRPIKTVIVFGVTRESRLTTDQGKIRTAGDYLGMNGHTNANVLAAVASYIWQYREKGRITGQRADAPTKSQILAFAAHYKDIPESIGFVSQPGNAAVGGKSVLAFCHWQIKQKSGSAKADEFVNQLISGDNISGLMLRLRNRLVSKEKLSANQKIELIFRTWNALALNEKPRGVMALGGPLPKLVR